MENCKVVDVLQIPLLEIRRQAEPFTEEVEGVESFGLCFGDGWKVFAAWESTEADKVASSVLQSYSFRG